MSEMAAYIFIFAFGITLILFGIFFESDEDGKTRLIRD